MKKIFLPIAILAIFTFSHCGSKKSEPTASEVNTGILTSKGWTIQSVMIDNTSSSSFAGLTLNFTSTTYTTTNGKVVWPANGTWAFTDANAKTILREDQVKVSLDEISNNKLVLSLDWATSTLGGRTNSVTGRHVFTFTR